LSGGQSIPIKVFYKMSSLKIVSYNVNGIRAAMRKGFAEWMKAGDFDIVCLQETKARPEQVEVEVFEQLGYHHHWVSAEKKGYSGVAIFSKNKPDKVVEGCGVEEFDSEGRVIRADFGDLTVVNIYFPSGTAGGVRQEVKYRFLDHIYMWANELRKEHPKLIILGDYNIAHTEMDIHNPKSNKNNSGFLPEERDWMMKWFDNGFTDTFRHLNPEQIQYSWWSYRANARANNKGWRIDYISTTDNLQDQLKACRQITDAKHSDHCPVFLELK